MKELRCVLLGEEQRPWTCLAVLRSPWGGCECEQASERVCVQVADSAPLLPLTKEVMEQDWFTGRKCTLPSLKYITAVALVTSSRPGLNKKKEKHISPFFSTSHWVASNGLPTFRRSTSAICHLNKGMWVWGCGGHFKWHSILTA